MAVTLADVGLALRRGEVLADDGSLHSTVQAAENAASSFIWLPPETFNESVTVDTAGLMVMGSGRDTLIDGGTAGDAISIEAANVIVQNLSLETTAGQGNSFNCIGTGTNGDSGVINRVWFRDSDKFCIWLEHGTDWLVTNCVFEGSDGRATEFDVARVAVVGCIFQSGVGNHGVSLSGDDSIAAYNVVNSSGNHGIQTTGVANDCLIIGNRIIGAVDGISVGGADNIIANNNITGSSAEDIDDNGTNTLIDANVPSVVLTVDDFESGNITGVTAPWNNWAGDTGSFSAQTGTVLAGSESGELAAANATVDVTTSRNDATNTITKAEALVQADNQTANTQDEVQLSIELNGTVIAFLQLEGDGDITDHTGADLGDWAVDTTYRLEFQNIDFDGETLDLEVIRTSDSTTVASATDVSFSNSVNEMDDIRFFNQSSNSGQTVNAYIDEIKTTR